MLTDSQSLLQLKLKVQAIYSALKADISTNKIKHEHQVACLNQLLQQKNEQIKRLKQMLLTQEKNNIKLQSVKAGNSFQKKRIVIARKNSVKISKFQTYNAEISGQNLFERKALEEIQVNTNKSKRKENDFKKTKRSLSHYALTKNHSHNQDNQNQQPQSNQVIDVKKYSIRSKGDKTNKENQIKSSMILSIQYKSPTHRQNRQTPKTNVAVTKNILNFKQSNHKYFSNRVDSKYEQSNKASTKKLINVYIPKTSNAGGKKDGQEQRQRVTVRKKE